MIGDDFYIGSSKYLYKRIQEHVTQLRRKEHTVKIQEAFDSNKYFDVYSIEKDIDKYLLSSKEMQYIRSLNPSLNSIMAKSDLRIKELCKAQGITQAQLAEKIGIQPVSFSQAISRNNFDMNYLKRIADALGVTIPELFDKNFLCPHCGKPIKITLE